MSLFFTGDVHREFDVHKLSALAWPEQKSLTREDFLIICGDFGCIWDGSRTDEYWLDWHNNKPYTTLVCLGNQKTTNSSRKCRKKTGTATKQDARGRTSSSSSAADCTT